MFKRLFLAFTCLVSMVVSGNHDICDVPSRLVEPRSLCDSALLNTTRTLTTDLLRHLKTQVRHSHNANTILSWFPEPAVSLAVGEGVAPAFIRLQHKTHRACLFIHADVPDNVIVSRLQAKVCHELAHTTSRRGHDSKWLDTVVYLLNLSSRDLGWTNRLEPQSCPNFGLCSVSMCPRCEWVRDSV